MPQERETLETKSFGALEIKDAEHGEVAAVVATLGVVDKDGDVFLPDLVLEESTVKLSGYNHDVALDGAAPVGKGTLSIKGDKVVFQGKFFMSTTRGRESFYSVKELGADSEWSFGFPRRTTKTTPMTEEWRTKGARRLITGVTPIEASPVFMGAGFGTGTLYTKDAPPPPDPAIEAARVEAEAKATALSETNAAADRRFKRL